MSKRQEAVKWLATHVICKRASLLTPSHKLAGGIGDAVLSRLAIFASCTGNPRQIDGNFQARI